MLENITAIELDELIAANDRPIIIDVYATWCGPCKMFAPIFERVAAACADSAYFVKIDVDAVPELAQRFGIQHVPTLIALRDGEEAHRSSGVMNEPALRQLVESLA